MKISKRLLAVLMAVVMILTIVPLGLFVFAEGEEPEPPEEEPAREAKTWHIKTLDDFNDIGNEEKDMLLSDNYILDNDIICKDATIKLIDWASAEANYQTIGNLTKLKPLYKRDEGTEYNSEIKYYSYDGETETYTEVTFTEETPYVPGIYYVENGYGPVSMDDIAKLSMEEAMEIFEILDENTDFKDDPCTINPVGAGAAFEGTFDGQKHKITGVKFEKTSGSYCGLFENNKGTIKDLTTNVMIDFYPDLKVLTALGGITGINSKDAKIENCKFYGVVWLHVSPLLKNTENSLSSLYSVIIQIGGIAGMNFGTIDDKCTSEDAVITTDYVGGSNINAGRIVGVDNDVNLLTEMGFDPENYPIRVADFTEVPEGTDVKVVRTEQVKEVDKYQLITIYENEYSSLSYIRMATCAHSNAQHFDAVTPTCKTAGNIEYWKCPDCNLYFTSAPNINTANVTSSSVTLAKDKANHDASTITATAAVPATCGKAGNVDYWYCSTCKKYLVKDDEGTITISGDTENKYKEVKQSDTVVQATGNHENVSHFDAVAPTYDATGNKEYWKCDDCGQYFLEEACTTAVNYDKDIKLAKLVPPTVNVKSGSGYKATTTGGKNTIILPNPSSKSGTTVATLKSNLQDGYNYIVKDVNGKTVTSGVIGTKYTVEIEGFPSTARTIIVRGDTDCNGKITSMDYVKIKNHILKKNVISDEILKVAADANTDGKISSLDYVRIKNIMLKG